MKATPNAATSGIFVLVALWLLPSCNRPTAPTVPPIVSSTDDSEAQDSAESGDETEQLAADAKPLKIPPPPPTLMQSGIGATVRLSNPDFDASGVVIRVEEGSILVLTAAHAVAENIDRVEVFSWTSVPRPLAVLSKLNILSTDERADLALIRVMLDDEIKIVPMTLAKTTENAPKYGYSVGCSSGRAPSILSEEISSHGQFSVRLPEGTAKRYLWQTDSPQETGRSGGPLLNKQGSLIGIALGKRGQNGYYSHIREISGYLIDNDLAALVTCDQMSPKHP